LKRSIITTSDGSKTIQIGEWNEQYHSIHGAIQEAKHVFIKMGLNHFLELHKVKSMRVLEMGLGTGLNAFITALEAEIRNFHIHYEAIEAFPVLKHELSQLNYPSLLANKNQESLFETIHDVSWATPNSITTNFTLTKVQQYFSKLEYFSLFDLVYFDAFGPRVQPDLWTPDMFRRMFNALKPRGVLVTYSAKGSVRRAMQSVGFFVERLEGPPGKREMLRATKPA
jgi:tRNA U34 5-methylaminomethyl-2-thiouridine-forming methyltransferase MnmC